MHQHIAGMSHTGSGNFPILLISHLTSTRAIIISCLFRGRPLSAVTITHPGLDPSTWISMLDATHEMMMSVSCQNAGSMTTLSFSLSLRFPRTHPRSPRTPERKLILPPFGIDDLSG